MLKNNKFNKKIKVLTKKKIQIQYKNNKASQKLDLTTSRNLKMIMINLMKPLNKYWIDIKVLLIYKANSKFFDPKKEAEENQKLFLQISQAEIKFKKNVDNFVEQPS